MAFQPQITGLELWVDSVSGNDATAERNRPDLPFATIVAAVAAASTGDCIKVRPGTYPEEGIVLNGISLVSTGQWEHTVIGPAPASSTQDTIQVQDQGYLQGFSINVPQGAFNAVNFRQGSGTNSVYDVAFYGDGGTSTSSGTAINRTGGGKTIGANIRVEGGGMANCLRVDTGVLALEGIHVPQSTGTIDNVLLVTSDDPTGVAPTQGGRAQMVGFNSGNSNVTNAIRVEGGGATIPVGPGVFLPTAIIIGTNIFNCANALSSSGQYMVANLLNGRIENVTTSVNVDLTGTGTNAVFRINANHQPDYIYSPQVAANAEFALNFTQEETTTFDSSYNIFGAEQLSVGFTERGTTTVFGKGAPFTTGMSVFTTDGTASSVSDGGNITDVSDDAKSKTGSTFTFQGTTPGHTILIASQRKDVLNNPIKFFGIEAFVDTGETGGGAYVFEAWNGTAWVETGAMSVSRLEGYSYGKDHFLRDDADEYIRVGIDNNNIYTPSGNFGITENTWAAKSITPTAGPGAGTAVNSFYLRIRITSAPTTAPIFERFKLLESSFKISKNGVPSGTGLAMFRKTISVSGRVWSGAPAAMGGTTLGNTQTVMGNTSAVNWTQQFNDSLGVLGDTWNVQIPIPIGTCTAFPITISWEMEHKGGTGIIDDPAADDFLNIFVLPTKPSGSLIADSTGGKIPIKRTLAQTDQLSAAGSRDPLSVTVGILPEGYTPGSTTWADVSNQIHEIELAKVDISTLYETDTLIIQIVFDATSASGGSIVPYSLVVDGVAHQDGKGI